MSAHVLRSISEVVQTKRGRGRSFGNRLSRLLREAMELRQAYHRGEAADFAAEAERLRREATYHLRDRPMSDADNWRLQNELGWHHDRGNLLRFLDDPSIEPTNNRAERALRPAVIARKVSHCSKNVGGADAFSAFTSVIRTLARNGGDHSLVNGLCGVFSGAPVPPLPSEPLLALRSANQLLAYILRKSIVCPRSSPFAQLSGSNDGYSEYRPPLTPSPMMKAPPPEPWSVPLPLSLILLPNSVNTTSATSSEASWAFKSWKKSIMARESSPSRSG